MEPPTSEQALQAAVESLAGVDHAEVRDLALRLNKLLQGKAMDVVVVASAVLALDVARVALGGASIAVRDDSEVPPEAFVGRVVEHLARSAEFAEAFQGAGGVGDQMGRA